MRVVLDAKSFAYRADINAVGAVFDCVKQCLLHDGKLDHRAVETQRWRWLAAARTTADRFLKFAAVRFARIALQTAAASKRRTFEQVVVGDKFLGAAVALAKPFAGRRIILRDQTAEALAGQIAECWHLQVSQTNENLREQRR